MTSDLLLLGLRYGVILSALLTALILLTLYRWPMVWAGDAPADIQAVAGQPTAADRRVKRLAGGVLALILIGMTVAAVRAVAGLSSGRLAFSDVYVVVTTMFMTFNLVDLVIIDWLLVATIRPSFAVLPGTAHMSGYGDYGFYFRGFLKGTVMILVAGAIVAAAAVGLDRLT